MSADPFALFGLTHRYLLDEADLQARYHALQRELHPDRYALAGEAERRLAATRAADLNDAWRQLRDPVARARALLSIAGQRVDEDGATLRDTGFLMEQMTLREALDEARADALALRAFADDLAARRARAGEAFAQAHARGEMDAALRAYRALQFLARLAEELARAEDDLLDGH
ncbi:MAG: Fe-S protein assembly co-chaperone HscB [Halothiobacillaceae bacterium]|nr:Fe-S protein assembly co-chaperone HscB [Halothiobacillaceae bacterium]